MTVRKEELSQWLYNLSTSIDTDTISEKDLQRVSEMFMTFQCEKCGTHEEYSMQEITKFMVLGWYIYTQGNEASGVSDASDVNAIDIDSLD